MVVNFDCVGNGDHMIIMTKEKAEALAEYKIFKEAMSESDGFAVHFIPFKKSLGNSDHKSFPCGVGVVASKPAKFFKFCTGRIHTNRDTIAENSNIQFLADRMIKFANNL